MTETRRHDETLTAALIQISGHAERIAALDQRYQQLADALGEVADRASAAAAHADGGAAKSASVLASLDILERQVADLNGRLAVLAGDDADAYAGAGEYRPVPAPRWWRNSGPERKEELDRLRAWVSQVYRPCFGQLAAILPTCWEEHPLCLNALDWLSELWSVLYLTAERTPEILAAQAEWQTRLLPSAADQMAAEADGCPHSAGGRRLTAYLESRDQTGT
jgi:hypothetical protein